MAIRLVTGLGNPGSRYERTRHNVGFRVLDGLASEWSRWKDLGEVAKARFSGAVYLVKPQTYMNLSGRMVGDFARYHRVPPSEVLVCYDDLDLPLGRLRIRLAGSAGGHHGMESIIEALGTSNVARLRVGIGPVPSGRDPADFVLGRLTSEEEAALERALADARAAVETAVQEGVETAMNRYNPAGAQKP